MARQQIKQKETQVATNEGVGKQLESTLTVEDNILPSPQELQAYKEVDPKIVDMLISTSIKEQDHRHFLDKEKMDLIKKSDSRIDRLNWGGMFLAFLSVVTLVVLAAYALYLDRPWFAGIIGLTSVGAVASLFIRKEPRRRH